jgi:hypothetical protein
MQAHVRALIIEPAVRHTHWGPTILSLAVGASSANAMVGPRELESLTSTVSR